MGGNLRTLGGGRRRRSLWGWLLPLTFLGLETRAAGQIIGIDSLEWMVADADVVVRARPLHHGTSDDSPPDPYWTNLTFVVTETFRGPYAPGETITIRLSSTAVAKAADGWKVVDDERLLFLVSRERVPDVYRGAGSTMYPHAPRAGPWFLCRRPGVGPDAFTMDFRRASGWEGVCEAVRRAAAHKPVPLKKDPASYGERLGLTFSSTGDRAVRMWAPSGSDVYKAQPVSAAPGAPARQPFLVVPADDRIEQLAVRWAQQGPYNAQALHVLRHYESATTNETLRRLLDDPTHEDLGDGKAAVWWHPQRATAYEVLRRRGVPVRRPQMSMPHDARRPASLARAGAYAAFGLSAVLTACVLGAGVSRRRAGARAGRAGVLWWAWRSLIVLLALAATGILLLAVRSHRRVDEVAYSTPTARRWMSTYRGSLQVVSLGYWPEAMPPSYATFDLASSPASPWEDGGVVVAKKAGWGPFRHVDGTLAQRLWTRPRPYQSFHAPLWSFALLVGLLPLVSGARWAGRRLRTRSRRRQGRCLACGYDLRGNASPERCPECGEPTPTAPSGDTARAPGPRAAVGMLLAGLTAVSLGGRTAQAGTVTRLGTPAWAQAERAAPNGAARENRAVRTDEDVASLRVFLEHPAADVSGVGRSRRVTYPLRRTAYVVLRNWGVPTPMPVINDPIDSQRPLGVLAPGAAGVLLVAFACALLPRPPRRLGISNRVLPAALKRGALTALALAALLLVTLALRGRTHADEVTFTARGSRHWVSSCDGKLEWTTIRGWPATPDEPAEPSFASFPLGGPLDVRWRQGPQNATGEQTRLGMTQVDGTMPDFGNVQRAYRRVGMHCRTLAIAAGALPVVFVGMAGGRRLRRRFRVTVGRCKACGYDLRGTAGRCPECGEWRGPIRGRQFPPTPAASRKPVMACAALALLAVTSAAEAGIRSTS